MSLLFSFTPLSVSPSSLSDSPILPFSASRVRAVPKLHLVVDGHLVNWIESKALFGDEETHAGYTNAQLRKYRHRYGPGLVIYWFGYVAELNQQLEDGILLSDGYHSRLAIRSPLSRTDRLLGFHETSRCCRPHFPLAHDACVFVPRGLDPRSTIHAGVAHARELVPSLFRHSASFPFN